MAVRKKKALKFCKIFAPPSKGWDSRDSLTRTRTNFGELYQSGDATDESALLPLC